MNHYLICFIPVASPADGNPKSPGMATQLEPEIWKTAISMSYFFLVTILTSMTMVVVHGNTENQCHPFTHLIFQFFYNSTDRVPDMKVLYSFINPKQKPHHANVFFFNMHTLSEISTASRYLPRQCPSNPMGFQYVRISRLPPRHHMDPGPRCAQAQVLNASNHANELGRMKCNPFYIRFILMRRFLEIFGGFYVLLRIVLITSVDCRCFTVPFR